VKLDLLRVRRARAPACCRAAAHGVPWAAERSAGACRRDASDAFGARCRGWGRITRG